MGGCEEGEGRDEWEGTQPTIQHCLEQEKPPKVTTLCTIPHHKAKEASS